MHTVYKQPKEHAESIAATNRRNPENCETWQFGLTNFKLWQHCTCAAARCNGTVLPTTWSLICTDWPSKTMWRSTLQSTGQLQQVEHSEIWCFEEWSNHSFLTFHLLKCGGACCKLCCKMEKLPCTAVFKYCSYMSSRHVRQWTPLLLHLLVVQRERKAQAAVLAPLYSSSHCLGDSCQSRPQFRIIENGIGVVF